MVCAPLAVAAAVLPGGVAEKSHDWPGHSYPLVGSCQQLATPGAAL